MTEREKRAMRCCFTGHRPEKLVGREEAVKAALDQSIELAISSGKRTFISGMARGVDLWAAELVLKHRRKNAAIRLICALPHPHFEVHWSAYWQQQYHSILHRADFVKEICPFASMASYQARSAWMVDHSSLVIAVFNGQEGGTKNTIEYANRRRVPVSILDMRYIDRPQD